MDLTISGHLERKKKMENNEINCLGDILKLKPKKLELPSKEEMLEVFSKPYKIPEPIIIGSAEFIEKFIENLPLKYK